MSARTLARLGGLAVVGLVGVVVASGCSSTLRNAATVTYPDGDSDRTVNIRRDDFEDDLATLADSEDVRAQLEQAGVSSEAPTTGTVDANLSAFWMTRLIQGIAVEAEFEARDLTLTEEQRQAAEDGLGGVLDDLEKPLFDQIVDDAARQQALIDALGADVPLPTPPTEEELRALYDQNAAALNACETGKEVSHVLVDDAATADAVVQELAAGAPFAQVAAARSTDGSAAQGGSLGCLQAGAYVPEFQQAADSAPLDQVVGPVQSEFGYHVILVTAWSPSFEKVRDQLAQQVASQAEQQAQSERTQRFSEALVERLDAMKVKVDPRYGSWDTESGQYTVVAPSAPTPRDQREPSTTTSSPLPEIIGG